MKPYKAFRVVLFFCLLFIVPAGCKKGGGAQQAGSETAQSVSTAEVISEDIERRIDITGTLAPWEEATISVEVDGRIVEVNVDLGDQVKKDDVLARIMPVEYEWKKTQAEADLSTAEADYKRLTQLIQNSVASKQQLDEAKRRLDVARATADLARKKFSDTVLRAPFHGSIAKRFINAGEYIRAGASAFYVVRVNPIKFKGDVPERYAGDVHRDDHVLAYTESSTLSLPGTIVRVGPSVASDSRSFPVEAEIDNSEGRIKPGSFARVSILTRKLQNMLTVPETAVFTFAGNTRVFVVKDNAAHERIIETSGKLRDRVLVVKGLSAGEKVVTTGVELLTDGKPVTLR